MSMPSLKLIDVIRIFDLLLIGILVFSSITSGVDVELHKCWGAKDLSDKIIIPSRLVTGSAGNDLMFRLNNKPLKCPTHWIEKRISKIENKSEIPKTATPTIKFTPTGDVFLHKEYFSADEYCISRNDETSLQIAYCEAICGVTHVCVTKCCGLGKVYRIGEEDEASGCVPSGTVEWSPAVYSKDNYKGCGQKVTHLRNHVRTSEPCSEGQELVPYPYKSIPNLLGTRFRLLDDGRVVFNIEKGVWNFHNTNFCMDGLVQNSENFTGHIDDQVLIACSSTEEEDVEHSSGGSIRTVVYTVFIILGVVFLVMTAIVYLLLWDKHNIHGWAVFSFVVSMLLFFTALAASHIMAEVLDSGDNGSTRCILIAIIVHFFFLSTMCWMSVINVDLWLTFRSLAPSNGRRKMIRRYCMYSAFAIGVPFLIVVFGIILDATSEDVTIEESRCELTETVVRPNYGQEGCRVQPSSEGLYLYLPMGILIGSNILMFSSTVFTLWRYRSTAQNAINASSSAAGNQKQSLILFCKLFIVMGVTWVTEIISWSLSSKDSTADWYIWIIFDVINLLQAVAVFFIFAAKRENLYAIYRKYPWGKKFIEPIMRLGPCRMGNMDVEQTDMTSADKNRIDRSTKVSFTNARISTASQDDY